MKTNKKSLVDGTVVEPALAKGELVTKKKKIKLGG